MIKKVCNIFLTIIFIVLIGIAGIMFVPRIMGYDGYVVVSGSMEPNIPVGSLVYIKEVSFDDISVGDIITFKMGDNVVTHRVNMIDQENQMIQTKGDANDSADGSMLSMDNVLGKMAFSVPLIGYITTFAKSPLSIAVICGLIFIVILLNFLPEIFENDKE